MFYDMRLPRIALPLPQLWNLLGTYDTHVATRCISGVGTAEGL